MGKVNGGGTSTLALIQEIERLKNIISEQQNEINNNKIYFAVVNGTCDVSSSKPEGSIAKFTGSVPLSQLDGYPSNAKQIVGFTGLLCYYSNKDGLLMLNGPSMVVYANITATFICKAVILYTV